MKKPSPTKSPSRTAIPSNRAELLFEIGTEELPFEFIAPAMAALHEESERLLTGARLSRGAIRSYGTPRRLVLVVEELATHQSSVVKETMGPSKAVAFDQSGQPTKAALGFAAGQGISVESLQMRQTPKGEYLWAVKEDAGRATESLLSELLPQLVGRLSFPKAMKWNEAGVRFARPVRWLVALFAGKVVPVEIAKINAGNQTFGHRVMGGGEPIVVRDYSGYNESLERAGVLVDPAIRRDVIQDQLRQLCTKAGVMLNVDDSLLDQAVFTTEWPWAVMGNFKAEYLAVPSDILMTSMKKHQGFFSVRDKNTGKVAPHFIAVVNNRPKDLALIAAGNERVLAARLADAKFFFDEDRKVKLEARVKKLEGVTFHQKLGTMAQKQERLVKLAARLAATIHTGIDTDDVLTQCRRAAYLSKADLLTGIVGEFPELQGIMGGEYARHDGEPPEIWEAIRDQYLPRGMEGEIPARLTGKIIALADRLDTITAFFLAGIVPKGSEDPFALRRHALSIVRIVVEGDLDVDLICSVDQAAEIAGQDIPHRSSTISDPLEFLFERFRFYAGTVHGLRDDVIMAVGKTPRSHHQLVLKDLLSKMKSLQTVTSRPEFDPLIVGFKRASRIVDKEQWDRKPVDPALFEDPAEAELWRELAISRKEFDLRTAAGDYDEALNALVRLKPAIDEFFAKVMVNAEDAALRSNRLSLLKGVEEFFKSFADFSKIVVQGT